jgi:hypothetical protein
MQFINGKMAEEPYRKFLSHCPSHCTLFGSTCSTENTAAGKMNAAQLLKNFTVFYGTLMSSAMPTRARHCQRYPESADSSSRLLFLRLNST